MRAPRRSLTLAASVAALAAVAGLAWFVRQQADVVQTATAELRSLQLPDGTRASLGPQTWLRIDFSGSERRLVMRGGEAYFEVAPESGRPFSVETPAGRVIAVGTAFSVRADKDRFAVAVTAGRVRIEPARQSSGIRPMLVAAGNRLISDSGRVHIEPQSAAEALAWQERRLEYQGEPLRVVIGDINRYSAVKVRIADPALENLRYTGTVFPDTLEVWLTSLEGVFPLRVETLGAERRLVVAH